MQRIQNLSPPMCTAIMTLAGIFFPLRMQVGISILLWSGLVPHLRTRRSLVICLSCACVLFFSLSLRRQYWVLWMGIPLHEVVRVEGFLREDTRRMGGRTMMILSLQSVSNARGISADARRELTVYVKEAIELTAGRKVIVSGKMYHSPRSLSFQAESVFTGSFLNKLWEFRRQTRQWIMNRFNHLDQDIRSLLYALLIGNRGYMDPLLLESFRGSGNMHVLALSGMHLTLLALVLIRGIRLFCPLRLTYGVTIVVLGGYVGLAGFPPSLIRAYLMFLTYAIFRMGGIPLRISTVIASSFLVVLVLYPSIVFSLSYQLSISALSGIIILGTRLSDRVAGYLPRVLREPWCASAGAVMFSSPLTLATFGFIPVFSFLLSPVVGICIAVIFLLGILQIFIPLQWGIPHILSGVYEVLIWSVEMGSLMFSVSTHNILSVLLFFIVVICTSIFLWKTR